MARSRSAAAAAVQVFVCATCGAPVHAHVAATKGGVPCQCKGPRCLTTKLWSRHLLKGAGRLLRCRTQSGPLAVWS